MNSMLNRVTNLEDRLDAEYQAYGNRLTAHVTFLLGHCRPCSPRASHGQHVLLKDPVGFLVAFVAANNSAFEIDGAGAVPPICRIML
ncbi:hypothetical protein [Paraburkholderia sp. BL27I4N3]|uniref:hypothetical protein n=1 Tax=Paraburkholderia sp. BL27I4N3 TaxID=1938805 RepID=UPI0011C01A72|nr:hypothetical protein [Paraburkholderia sp. BL27I4N3]